MSNKQKKVTRFSKCPKMSSDGTSIPTVEKILVQNNDGKSGGVVVNVFSSDDPVEMPKSGVAVGIHTQIVSGNATVINKF